MSELLPLSIGVGLAVSLLLTEMFGLAAGGMIVPGYVALNLTRPLNVVATLLAGFVTYAVVRALGSVAIVYGRRRTALMILVGYLVGSLVRWGMPAFAPEEQAVTIVGYIIPGLIAIWLDRQGSVETVSALVIASVLVRLVLVLFVGADLAP